MVTDARPTKPITIDGVAHEIHIKPVLGDAGPFDLYDIWEVHALMSSGIYTDNLAHDPIAWRHVRQYHQNGPSMYTRFQMAPFTLASDLPLIPTYTREYVTVEGVEDFIDWVQSGEWNGDRNNIMAPIWGEQPYHEVTPGTTLGMIHSPQSDQMRADGKTEEEIYQFLHDANTAAMAPPTN